MKKILALSLLILAISPAIAQRKGGGPREKIREARIDFMKKKLALTAEEEKAFLPLYEKMIDDIDSLRKKYKQEVDMDDLDLTFMSDEECEKVVNDVIAFKEAEVGIIKAYTEKFKKILPIKKVAMVYKAEHEFKREIVKRLRERKKKK